MNTCPFANENVACNLSVPETEGNDGGTPKAAYCERCSQVAFRCSSGHWNRAFARFCTQCSQKLEKPAVWNMASANPQRTATLPRVPSVDSLDVNYGFGSWVVGTPKIETGQDLPGLLAIDGHIIVPNPGENRLDAYTIAKPEDERHLNHQWTIEFNTPLTHESTPIYHGLHLFSVVSGGIQRKYVFGGKTELININGVDASKIKPAPGCAPLKCDVNGKLTMVVGLKQGILLLDLDNYDGTYIKHEFFEKNNDLMSPTLCGTRVIFTSKQGGVFSFNIGTSMIRQLPPKNKNTSFSAPVSLNSLVYFEAISNSGKRSLARFDPESGKLSKAADLDSDNDLNRSLALFIHPPLTDGERLFLADRFGQIIYTYHSHQNFLTRNELNAEGGHQPVFVPHRSVVVNNRIYSAHSTGLTVINLNQDYVVSYDSLAMGWNDNPVPVAPPIRYGGNLFLLCKDRLVCLNY